MMVEYKKLSSFRYGENGAHKRVGQVHNYDRRAYKILMGQKDKGMRLLATNFNKQHMLYIGLQSFFMVMSGQR